jgi:hypothetical protein
MMNLEKCQAIYVGNIENVQHSATMKNGSFVNLGAKIKDDVYAVAVPATATLGTEEVLVIFDDETQAEAGKTISDFRVPANTPSRAYRMAIGDSFLLENADFTGTAVVGQFLVPVNGTITPAISATPTANTLQFVVDAINLTIGYGAPATRFKVERVK